MSKASLIAQADKLFASWFHNEYSFCAICGDSPVELHHLVRKGNKLCRWERLNSISLCSFHHRESRLLSAHGSPEAFEDWLAENMPEHHYFWKTHKDQVGVSLTEDWYRQKIEELKLL